MGLRALVVACLLSASCGPDPDTVKRQQFEAGDRFFAERRFPEAISAYRNVLRVDPNVGEARLRLGDAFAETADLAAANGEYVRASDLLPQSVEAQLKAATSLLLMGRFEDAQTRVQRVLDRDPKNAEALIVRGSALIGLNDLEGALEQLEEAVRIAPGRGLTYTNLAFLQLAKGKREDAHAAFKTAVELEPHSVPALLSLANFYVGVGEVAEAEQTLKKTLQVDPKHVLANRTLAALYLASDRTAEAEPYIKAIADGSDDPEARLALADYYRSAGRPNEARNVLESMVATPATRGGIQTRLAELMYSGGDRKRAHRTLDALLAKEPNNTRALLSKSAWLLDEGKSTEALRHATTATTSNPGSEAAHYLRGTIQASLYDAEGAIVSFREALRLNPRLSAAQVQLSRLEILRGDSKAAVQLASDALRADPDNASTRVSVARALIAQRDVQRAEPAVAALLKDFPNTGAVHALNGSLQLIKGDRGKARAAFERAVAIDADSFEAFGGLVTLDLLENKVDAARTRIDDRLTTAPPTRELLLLAARVYIAAKDAAAAERALRQAIEVAPGDGTAYSMLAQVYLGQGKLDAAQEEFDRIATRNSKDASARLMGALIAHSRGNVAEARKRYEEVLNVNPGIALASNNLAWILADQGTDLDRALRLAQRAVEQDADDAQFNDTLGWVYMKQYLPALAIRPFERAVATNPNNATLHYHLGMAYAGAGLSAKARMSLQKALSLKTAFPEAAEAKALLATLK